MLTQRKGLSIQQPWAWLIITGWKPIENRSWRVKHRGELLIHAGKKIDRNGILWVEHNFPLIPLPEEFETGGIVGVVNLDKIVENADSPWADDGYYHWYLSNARTLPFRPYQGRQGLMNIKIEE